MPSIANLTLENNAAAVVTATAMVPSAGDSVAAQWRIENAYPPFARTTISMVSRYNTKRTARHVDVKITSPYTVTDANTGQQVLLSNMLFTGTLVVPTNIPSANSDDMVAYIHSFFDDAGIVAALKAGYAPT